MELTPTFNLLANGVDVSSLLQKNSFSLELRDEDGSVSDELTLQVAGVWKRPKYKDELRLWLGYKESGVSYMGSFRVQTTERINNNELTITATGVEFSEELKVKKDREWKDVSLKSIISTIAGEHGLKTKCDADVDIKYIAQHDESDLAFLKRIADRYDLLFSIKNNTALMLDRSKKNERPKFSISAKECISLSIKHSNKTLYESAKAVWRDTKENQDKEVKTGEEMPQLRIEGSFKDEDEALKVAKGRLQKANRGLKSGSLDVAGGVIFAGGVLVLSGTVEDDGEYSIKRVTHRYDNAGWVTSIEFEN